MQTEQLTAASSLDALIAAIRGVTHGPDEAIVAGHVAEQLGRFLTRDDLLSEAQSEPDPAHYRQHVLHVEPDGSFSIVALVWLPGQVTPIHDHVSWCVVGVHRGQELETLYDAVERDGQTWLREREQSINPVGSVAALTPPGDIHKVANGGNALAISLHIYGADIGVLGSSIRRRYDHPLLAV